MLVVVVLQIVPISRHLKADSKINKQISTNMRIHQAILLAAISAIPTLPTSTIAQSIPCPPTSTVDMTSPSTPNHPISKKQLWLNKQKQPFALQLGNLAPAAKDIVRIMTYNVELLKNLNGVVATVASSLADIVVLQEVTNIKYVPLKMAMAEHGYKHETACWNTRPAVSLRKGTVTRIIGNAIFSKYTIEKSYIYDMHDKFAGRCLIEAKIYFDPQRGLLMVLGTHLTNGGGYASKAFRRAQLKNIARIAEFGMTKGYDVVLAGDMNTVIDELVNIQLQDAFTLPSVTKIPKVDSGTQWRGNRIDHILFSPPLTAKVVYTISSSASDHLPFVADIQSPGKFSHKAVQNTDLDLEIVQLEPRSFAHYFSTFLSPVILCLT